MARKNREEMDSRDVELEPVLCPMCERVIPDDQKDDHYLVPKSKGGKITVCLHRVCHSQIHAIFTDAQLAKKLFTITAILEDPAMQKFVTWVKTKPRDFPTWRRRRGPLLAEGASSNRCAGPIHHGVLCSQPATSQLLGYLCQQAGLRLHAGRSHHLH